MNDDNIELSIRNQYIIDSSLVNNLNFTGLDSTIINETGECYCCHENTDLRSPCVCRAFICDSCLVRYVKYNDKCTICNSELDIYIPTPTSTISSRSNIFSFSISTSFEDENIVNIIDIINSLKYLLYIYYGISLIHYFGSNLNDIFYNRGNNILYNLNGIVFIMGICYLIFTLIILFLLSVIVFLLSKIYNNIKQTLAIMCIAFN